MGEESNSPVYAEVNGQYYEIETSVSLERYMKGMEPEDYTIQ